MTFFKTALVLAPLALAACQDSRTMSSATPDSGASAAARSGGGSPGATPSVSGTGTMSGSSMSNSAPTGTGRQSGTSQR